MTTKQFPIISLPDGFLYAVEKKPEGNVYIRPDSPYGTIKGSIVEMKSTGLSGLYGSMPVDIPTIATTNPSLSLPLIPLEDDIEKVALQRYPIVEAPLESIQKLRREAYLEGLKVAKAKGKYSEEDMRKAWQRSEYWHIENYDQVDDGEAETFEEFIKSLTPSLKAIEIEMETYYPTFPERELSNKDVLWKPKLTNDNFIIVKRFIYE